MNDTSGVILSIDQGTTGTKAVLLDAELNVLGESSEEFPQHFPRPGWVEHELEEIFTSVRGAVSRVLEKVGLEATRIAAIGITNQRETTALWERQSGIPVYRAIVWQDRRTAQDCQAMISRGLESEFRPRTGLLIDPYFAGTKLAWLLKNVKGAKAKAESGHLAFGTIDTYLLWRLTGGKVHVTDVSNASRTLLMDLRSAEWSPELCEILEIPAKLLPEIRANDQVFGHTEGVDFLPDGIPIASVVGDQQAALFGQTCFEPGEAKCTYGTGAFLVLNTGKNVVESRHGLLSTAAWKLKGTTCYALEGSAFIAGAIVQWLRDGLGLISTSEEVEMLAASVADAGGVVLVPALTGLGAPHWAPEARGLIAGITRGTTKAHLARAALDGIAFQIHDLVRAMEKDVGKKVSLLKVDGGASQNDLLMQFQADILNTTVIRPKFISTTALGAALMAGLTVGLFPGVEAIRNVWQGDRLYRAQMKRKVAQARLEEWETALRRARV